MVEGLTPRRRASSANWSFQASKPAAVLPHCAALASPTTAVRAAKLATTIALNCLPVPIQNSFTLAANGFALDHAALCRIVRKQPDRYQDRRATLLPQMWRKSAAG